MFNPLIAPAARILTAPNVGQMTEFVLIQQLTAACDFIPSAFAGDALSLFRTHFLLFNALYQLQDEWQAEGLGYLHIDALRIELIPFGDSQAVSAEVTALSASQSPSLKAYYLDMSQLTETDRGDVEALLTQFWDKFSASDNRSAALAVLGLEEPVTMAEIKRAYRRKAMALHPDRGGNVTELQEVNHAMDQLKNYYR